MEERYQIGSITSGYRVIRPGDQYDKYFPKPQAQDRIIIEDGEVGDTVDLMKRVVWKYIDDTKGIAPVLKGKTLNETCENTWNFLYHHIQYKLDEAVWSNCEDRRAAGRIARAALTAIAFPFSPVPY